MNPYTIEQTEENVLVVRFEDISAGWEQWIQLSSDRHHDSPYCDRERERAHLDLALEREALVIDAGDVFDAMQGKYDPRASLDDVRQEDVGDDYLDRIVDHAAHDYAKYASNWLVVGRGNHETAIRKHNSTDLTKRLVYMLNHEHGGECYAGGYGGWVRFVFHVHGTKRVSCNLRYFHGTSTRAPVTRGVIQTNRQAVNLPDADVVLNGHNHEGYHVPVPRERLTVHGKIRRSRVDFVRTPGYKDAWRVRKGALGFEAMHGSQKLTGCAWLRFWYAYNGEGDFVQREVVLDVA